MSSNYTGNPTGVQTPASAPGPGVAPIVVLPSDGDPDNAAAFAQAFKVLADYIAFANAPYHIITNGTAPTNGGFGTGAGTGPTFTSITGNDTAGKVIFTTGTAPASSGNVIKITFNKTYAVAPIVVLFPTGPQGSSGYPMYAATTTTDFTITAMGGVALAGTTLYAIGWLTIGIG